MSSTAAARRSRRTRRTRRPRTRRPRRGFALLAVLVFSIAGLIFVAISQRHIAAAANAERNRVLREIYQEGALEAMAVAMEKLEARAPSDSSYACYHELDTSAGRRRYSVTYSLTAPQVWNVEVRPYAGRSLPRMPGLLP